ncbi:MAG: hypothetical protein KY466_04065 [Gemmatimonadetes bacterium]|nr:hypothetical protein [Gemmatimonadota bacterium]
MADTRGTNKDYDESQTSKNQGHGHPRDERGRSDHAGESNRSALDKVRGDDKTGGKVRRKEGENAGKNVRN